MTEGGYGEVFKGWNRPAKKYVAVKVDLLYDGSHSDTKEEYDIYKTLFKRAKGRTFGLVNILAFGQDPKHSILVMELMGMNLYELLKLSGGSFSLKTALQIAVQLIDRIELVHDLGRLT